MSEKKHHVASLYERSPAVAGLNQIQGFDPCKLLRRTVSGRGFKTGSSLQKAVVPAGLSPGKAEAQRPPYHRAACDL